MVKRKYFKATLFGDVDYDPTKDDRVEVNEPEANLVSSVGEREYYNPEDIEHFSTNHFPVLDLDFPCQLVPSSTPGKFHLYMDKSVTWVAYQNVLTAMASAGLLELGYVSASIARRATFVRKPGVLKIVK